MTVLPTLARTSRLVALLALFPILSLCSVLSAQQDEGTSSATTLPANVSVPQAPNFVPPPPPPGPPPTLPPSFSRSNAPATARGATRTERQTQNETGATTITTEISPTSRELQAQAIRARAAAEREAAQAANTPSAPANQENVGNTGTETGANNSDDVVSTIILSDADYNTVFGNLEELTGKSILRPQNLPAVKLNFNSQGPMTKSEAILALTSLLSLNGIVITDMGDKFLKAMPAGNAAAQIPPFIHGSTLDLPPSQAYYTKLFKLKYLNLLTEAQTIITPLMSAQTQGAYVPFPKTNSVLITDTLANLQRIETVLHDADQPQAPEEEIIFFQLNNTKATDLQSRLNGMIQNQSSGLYRYFSHNTTIEADERTNQLIVMTHPSNVPMLNQIVDKLDINVSPNTTSRVLYIKHAKATEIASLVKEVISGQQQQQQAVDTRNAAARRQAALLQQQQQQQAQQGQQPQQPRNVINTNIDTSSMRFSEFTVVVADERSNAVVIYGTQSDLDQIESLVEQIDILLAQVHIQVIIAEVKLNDNSVSGLDQLGITYSTAAGLGGSMRVPAGNVGDAPAFSFSGAVSTRELNIAIRNAVSSGVAKVLSAPVIVTTHNQEASVNVSESRPFITGSVTSGDGLGGVTQSVSYRDVGIQLTVTPLIGTNGVVQMEINQIVETFIPDQGVDVNGTRQPFIDKREATSFISVSDRETIVLAGLQQSEIGSGRGKLWLLGDLPIFGDWIFSSRTATDARRELMMFITPYVIYSQSDATINAESSIDNLDNSRDVKVFLETRDITEIYNREKAEQEAALTPNIFKGSNTHGPRR